MYLAYLTPYSETVTENSNTSDYGDSVSSPCITPTSPVFESSAGGLTSNIMDTSSCNRQHCLVTTSKSDGELAICKDCQKNLLESNLHSYHLDSSLKSKSCTDCRSSGAENIAGVDTPVGKDSVEVKSLYMSTEGHCSASVISYDDSGSEIESSMSSSTATVILDANEEDCTLVNDTSSPLEKLANGQSSEATQEALSAPENDQIAENSPLACGAANVTGFLSKDNCRTNLPQSMEEPSPGGVSKSSSDSTLSCDGQEATPSTTTLKPSSSQLFGRYLDVDGLTIVVDPVQERLQQIEMIHHAKLLSLQRQLADVQRKHDGTANWDLEGRVSDLADEVVCL